MKKGFTLIELLVVVLIIGILSVVALPQYRKSVARARMAEVVTASKAIYDAQMVYKMANGETTNLIEKLSVQYPLVDENPHRVKLSHGYCDLETDRVYCLVAKNGASYHRFYNTGNIVCCSYPETGYIEDSICKAETGATDWYNGCGERFCHCWRK